MRRQSAPAQAVVLLAAVAVFNVACASAQGTGSSAATSAPSTAASTTATSAPPTGVGTCDLAAAAAGTAAATSYAFESKTERAGTVSASMVGWVDGSRQHFEVKVGDKTVVTNVDGGVATQSVNGGPESNSGFVPPSPPAATGLTAATYSAPVLNPDGTCTSQGTMTAAAAGAADLIVVKSDVTVGVTYDTLIRSYTLESADAPVTVTTSFYDYGVSHGS